jgi:hypothetical protein
MSDDRKQLKRQASENLHTNIPPP